MPRLGVGLRKRMRATDSVMYRRQGRDAAEKTPFALLGAGEDILPAATVAADRTVPDRSARKTPAELSAKIFDSSGSSGSESDDEMDFVALLPDAACSSAATTFLNKVGHTLLDTDDNIRFRILAVCERRKQSGRGRSNNEFFYQYQEADDENAEMQYTPCREMLNSNWAKWEATSEACNRASRLAARARGVVSVVIPPERLRRTQRRR